MIISKPEGTQSTLRLHKVHDVLLCLIERMNIINVSVLRASSCTPLCYPEH